jgi:hypothetical protein
MRLGKRPRRHDARTLKLARYLGSGLPAAPPRVDYSCGITNFGMMLNDQLGCCTIAAAAHAVQVWTANAGTEITFPDPVILDYYRTWDGYNPADPSTDQGGVELDVLNDWRKQGFARHGLDAYAALSAIPDSGFRIPEVQTAIWLFGGVYIGLELPLSAQDQEVWDLEDPAIGRSGDRANGKSGELTIGRSGEQDEVDHPITGSPDHRISSSSDDPGSWGGHAVFLVGYDTTDSESRIPNSGVVTTPALSAPPLLNQEGSFGGTGTPARAPTVARVSSPAFCTGTPWRAPTGAQARVPVPRTSAQPGVAVPPGGLPCLHPPVPSAQPSAPSPGTFTCITWGQLKRMTWPWFQKYCSEAYALISKDWIKASGLAPSGFDMATLEADLKTVTSDV